MAWKLTTFACGAKQAQGDCLLRWRRQTAPRGLFLRAVLVYAAVFPVYVLQRLLESLAEREELDGSDETVPGSYRYFSSNALLLTNAERRDLFLLSEDQEQKTVPKSELTGFAAQCDSKAPEDNMQNYYEEMSINQIMNGDETFPSLILVVKQCVASTSTWNL